MRQEKPGANPYKVNGTMSSRKFVSGSGHSGRHVRAAKASPEPSKSATRIWYVPPDCTKVTK
jgi:hypothetical protein